MKCIPRSFPKEHFTFTFTLICGEYIRPSPHLRKKKGRKGRAVERRERGRRSGVREIWKEREMEAEMVRGVAGKQGEKN